MRDDIERLREDLYRARRTVVELVPDQFRSILDSYVHCSSHEEYVEWRRGTADRIIELALARPSEEMRSLPGESPRAICPLCGNDSNNPFGIKGFAIPDGLLRHLEGSHNAIQCRVFEIACALARERLRST
jgi:hypothetical protein